MTRAVRFRELALRDVDELLAFLAKESPGAAGRFAVALEGAGLRIASFPRLGHPVGSRIPAVAGLRTWPVPGFPAILVLYAVPGRAISVVRVVHGARDLPGLFEPAESPDPPPTPPRSTRP